MKKIFKWVTFEKVWALTLAKFPETFDKLLTRGAFQNALPIWIYSTYTYTHIYISACINMYMYIHIYTCTPLVIISLFSMGLFLFFLFILVFFLDPTNKWNHAVLSFSVWCISISIILARSIHVVSNAKIPFFFMSKNILLWVLILYHIFFIYFLIK